MYLRPPFRCRHHIAAGSSNQRSAGGAFQTPRWVSSEPAFTKSEVCSWHLVLDSDCSTANARPSEADRLPTTGSSRGFITLSSRWWSHTLTLARTYLDPEHTQRQRFEYHQPAQRIRPAADPSGDPAVAPVEAAANRQPGGSRGEAGTPGIPGGRWSRSAAAAAVPIPRSARAWCRRVRSDPFLRPATPGTPPRP